MNYELRYRELWSDGSKSELRKATFHTKAIHRLLLQVDSWVGRTIESGAIEIVSLRSLKFEIIELGEDVC